MHDPMTVAFDIKYPWWQRGFQGRREHSTFLTIWHVDPETDGSDDSCGWFKRARHGDPKVLERISKDFAFYWDRDRCCWFDAETQLPQCSTVSIVLHMFRVAAKAVYQGRRFDEFGWRSSERFMRRHLHELILFAENPLDSMRPFIEQLYGPTEMSREERIADAAGIVYGYILRRMQPWYRHARWHVWHWKFQVHPAQAFKRWAFSRCAGCGKRFTWGYAPVSGNWNGGGPRWFRGEPGVFHSACFPSPKMAPPPQHQAPQPAIH